MHAVAHAAAHVLHHHARAHATMTFAPHERRAKTGSMGLRQCPAPGKQGGGRGGTDQQK
jgi:hypothetical protein